MKTIDKRRSLALGLVIGLVLGFVLVVFLTSPEFLRQLSPSGHEIFFNFLFLAVALVLSFFFLVLYSKCRGPFKDFCPLIGAGFLILLASGLFGLYDDLHKLYSAEYVLTSEEKAVQTRLTENLNILRLVVPAVMLGVAANLITIFLHNENNSDKSPPP